MALCRAQNVEEDVVAGQECSTTSLVVTYRAPCNSAGQCPRGCGINSNQGL